MPACLQSGVAVKLLAVQYRMHPEIRSFPSKFFYDNALQDALQVRLQPKIDAFLLDVFSSERKK